VDEGLLAETDLSLGGMNVDVDFVGRHFEEEEDDGERGGRDDVAVGLNDGVDDETIADEALVDEDVDRVAVEFLQRGAGDEAADAEEAGIGRSVVAIAAPGRWFGDAGVVKAALGGQGEELVESVAAEDLIDALGRLAHRRRCQQRVGGGVKLEVDFGMGERVMRHQRGYMSEFGGFGAEKFAAGWRVEEEVADGDGGAGRTAGIFDGEDFAACDFDAGPGGALGWTSNEFEARDGGDGGERFAAEAEGGDGEQIVGRANFGGCVTLEGEQGVVAHHAATVVGNADEAATASFDFDADAGGAGIEGVLQQLLDDGGGAVDDLAGGDLVGDLVGENADAAHAGSRIFALRCGEGLDLQRIEGKELLCARGLEQSIVGANEADIRNMQGVPHDNACGQMQCVKGTKRMAVQHQPRTLDHRRDYRLLYDSRAFGSEAVEGLIGVRGQDVPCPLTPPNC